MRGQLSELQDDISVQSAPFSPSLEQEADNGPKDKAGGVAEGQWVTAACWHNCGGRCLNKVLVVEGKVCSSED